MGTLREQSPLLPTTGDVSRDVRDRCSSRQGSPSSVDYVMPLFFPLFGEDPAVVGESRSSNAVDNGSNNTGTAGSSGRAEPPLSDAEVTRSAFVSGLKAAFLVSQLNRLGQVLCGRCGRSWEDLTRAHAELTIARIVESGRGGYKGGLAWEDDHPNNVMLVCVGCLDSTEPAHPGRG
jgi:hypothetical protein